LRRAELAGLELEDFQVREEHWVIADLIGNGKHIRTVPVPVWAKRAVDEWTEAAKINQGAIFRRVSRQGKVRGEGLTPKAIWHIVKAAAKRADIKNLAPHDLRRYAAWLGANLNKFSSCLGTHRFRQPSIISDANRNCDTRSMTTWDWKTSDRELTAQIRISREPAVTLQRAGHSTS
jgi:integrase